LTHDAVLDVVKDKDKNKAYEQALSAWAGKSKYLDAIDDGKGILSNKLSSDELKAKFADANLALLKKRDSALARRRRSSQNSRMTPQSLLTSQNIGQMKQERKFGDHARVRPRRMHGTGTNCGVSLGIFRQHHH
jgi:hypothetical protein